MRFPIGTQFVKVGRKSQATWTVTNYRVTTDLQGTIVKTRYVAETSFLGQTLTYCDVVDATIARGLMQGLKPIKHSVHRIMLEIESKPNGRE